MAEFETVRRSGAGVSTAEIDAGLRAHMNKVYGLMSVAMVITGIVSYVVGMDLKAALNGQETMLLTYGMIEAIFASPAMYVVMFAPLIMVFLMGPIVNRLSQSGAQMFFYAFSAVMGLSLASIFVVYTGESIAQMFFITAIAFASLSLWGYTTKRDLSGMGSFLIMGLVGILVAMIVNIWLQSEAIMFAVSILGVLIFAGLTAYDTQNIKNGYLSVRTQPNGEAVAGKMAIFGALNLYLDFINMMLFLLRLFGNRN